MAPSCGDSEPGTTRPVLTPVAPSQLPAAVRRQVEGLREALAGPRAVEVVAWRGMRRAALRRLASGAPLPADDGPVYVVGFRGPLTYRRARHPPGMPAKVSGRFAYASYAADDGTRLDFGVLRRAPFR